MTLGIYNLLCNKFDRCKSLDIEITFETMLNFKDIKMDTYELSRILGILLDNSIEAASNSNEKLIYVCFRDEPNNHRHCISIENSYENKNVKIDSIFTKNQTDKENHSGLGLYEVSRLLNKKHNNNLNLFTSKNDKFFKQQLEIYY